MLTGQPASSLAGRHEIRRGNATDTNLAHPVGDRDMPEMLKTTLGPDDPCSCGGGLRYGDCHQELNEAADDVVLDLGRRRYAERWRTNAEAYETQDVYGRLARHLASFGPLSKIIDVGCGRGEGLAAIRDVTSMSGLLVGLDENPDCLHAASERLRLEPSENRLKRRDELGLHYDLDIIAGRVPRLQGICLVQTDLLRPDQELDAAMIRHAPFDAVTLWFSGIHSARQFDRETARQGVASDPAHRMAMDLAALEYAEAMVRPGGVFHVVSRAMSNNAETLRQDVVGAMRNLEEHGSVQLMDVLLIPYSEPTSPQRIGVGVAGLSAGDADTYAASTMFRLC